MTYTECLIWPRAFLTACREQKWNFYCMLCCFLKCTQLFFFTLCLLLTVPHFYFFIFAVNKKIVYLIVSQVLFYFWWSSFDFFCFFLCFLHWTDTGCMMWPHALLFLYTLQWTALKGWLPQSSTPLKLLQQITFFTVSSGLFIVLWIVLSFFSWVSR